MGAIDTALHHNNGFVENFDQIERIIRKYEQLLKDRRESLFIMKYTRNKGNEKEERKYKMKVAEVLLLEAALIELRKEI